MRTPDLFTPQACAAQVLDDGVVLLRGRADTAALMPRVDAIAREAPFRHMVTRSGAAMSVAMTNCGDVGWVSDRRGYRYDPLDPESGRPWPPMPGAFARLARACAAEAGAPGFAPDVCLVNRYLPGSRLGAHQDRDECDFSHPIVSVSMGLSATFLLYGATRGGRARRIALHDGDVVVLAGAGRRAFHGVGAVPDGEHPLTGRCRVNLTFRRAR